MSSNGLKLVSVCLVCGGLLFAAADRGAKFSPIRVARGQDAAATDTGLAHLKPLRRLRELYVYDTAITKTGLSELKKSKRPWFRSYENGVRRLID